ncbi:MAG TPA: hypothetical protein VEZ70_09045 [Allosphingosinicella sp.]|nr:hypothetical protein [Allosphingosinicella sp.]
MRWLLITAAVCVVGTVMSAFLANPPQGRDFFVSFVYNWNGFLVAPTALGALQFGAYTFRQQFHFLVSEILEIDSDPSGEVYFELERLFSWRNKQAIALPVFFVGTFILYICGYPLSGLASFLLWAVSSAMFYVGGMMLAYTIHSARFFGALEQNLSSIRLRPNVHVLELENFNLYLTTLFLAGAIALYFAFRGTLTANFTFVPPFDWIGELVRAFVGPEGEYKEVRNLLIYPLIIFPPYAMFAALYMRMVLRKIYLTSVKLKVTEIDDLARPLIYGTTPDHTADRIIEIRNAVMDLQQKVTRDTKDLALVGVKDFPSIVLITLVVVQFIAHNDGTVKGFLSGLIGIK